MRISKNKTISNPGAGLFAALNTKAFSVVKCILIIVFFATLTFALYAKTFHSPFILDDVRKIQENPLIRVKDFSIPQIINAGFDSSKTRPLPFISFAFNYSLHQYDVFGYHVFNISIHILTALFLYLFLKATFRIPTIQARYEHTDLISFFAALIWLVHPIQTQAVTYIVQRMTAMATLFFVLSFLFYAHGRLAENTRKKYVWLSASVAAWVLSLGCKQITAVLPFLVYLYEWYFFQDLSRQWFKKSLIYLLGISAFFILLALIYTGFSPWEKIQNLNDYSRHEFTIMQRLLTQFRVLIHYISLIFFPHPSRLNLDYDFALSTSLINPFTTLLCLMAIVGLTGLAILLARKERLMSFCILWFFGNLVVESSIIPLAIIFEHRLYLPSMMVLLIPVLLAFRYIKLDWLNVGLLGLLVVALAVLSYQRNLVWANRVTLWSDVVKKSPNKARPHFNLGSAYAKRSQLDKAIPLYERALEISPDLAQPHINLGEALEQQHKIKEATEHYRAALKLDPELPEAHNNMGAILAKQGRTEEAIQYYQNALKIRPHYATAHFNLGGILVEQGKVVQGISHYHKAIHFKPDYAEAFSNLGGVFLKLGNTEKAINHFNAAIHLDPNLAEAHNNLGIALMQTGNIQAAIRQFQTAVELKPDFITAENNLKRAQTILQEVETQIARLQQLRNDNPHNAQLIYEIGNLYFRKGDHHRAMQHYQKALQLNPRFVPALNNLALVMAANQKYYKALTVFMDILNYAPEDAETHYNIACMYARLKREDEAIEWLQKALDKGYTNWESIKEDSDLDNIRDSQAYRDLISGR